MSETKFTPGPWLTAWSDTHAGQIATIHGIRDELGHVCWAEIWSPIWPESPTQSANAHLIAAAPDLYAALSNFVEGWETGDGGPVTVERIAEAHKQACAALAKARGESS